MAVDMALWTLVAAVVGFLALGCMVTRKTTTGREGRDANMVVGTASDRLLAPSHRAGETLGLFGGAE
jgi:hypothetical protein